MSATLDAPVAVESQLITSGKPPILYAVSDAKIDEIRSEFTGMKIVGKDDYERVTKAIATCRKFRTEVEKCRKNLKEDALAYGRRVDSEAKRLTARLEEIEEPLKTEKARVDEEKERAKKAAEEAKRQRLQARIDQLNSVNARVNPIIIEEWSDEEFASQFGVAQAAFEEAKRIEQIEADRKAKEEADRQEAMRLEREKLEAEKAELAKLRAEQEAAAKIERDRVEAEQAVERKKLAEERAKQEEAQRVERAKIEAERAALQAEKDRLAREQFAREAAEREKREAAERAEQERLDAIRIEEERAEQERLRLEAIEEERKRREALAPDAEKLSHFAAVIRSLDLPKLTTQEGKDFLDNVKSSLVTIAIHCEEFSV